MTIKLTSDLEEMIRKQADQRRTTPEAIIMDVLRERFLPLSEGAPSRAKRQTILGHGCSGWRRIVEFH